MTLVCYADMVQYWREMPPKFTGGKILCPCCFGASVMAVARAMTMLRRERKEHQRVDGLEGQR